MENIDNMEVDLTNKEIIGKGSAGVVYEVDAISCYKKIYNKDYTSIEDQAEVLKTIKNLKLSNFCKIKDININGNGYVMGYYMPIYNNQDLDIMRLPKDYLLDSYKNIYNDILLLSKKGIYIKI